MPITLSISLLVLRAVGGLTLAAHGSQKLLGWFGGGGLAKQVQVQRAQGFKPAWLWTFFVVLGEFCGGLSFALGFLTPLGAAGICGAMLMAILKVHGKNGFWNSKRGVEFPLSLLTIAAAVGIAGPGSYAVDMLLNITLPQPQLFAALAAAAVIVDAIGVVISRSPAAMSADATPRGS